LLDLFAEFQALIQLLNQRELPYALCGGIALAVHGIPRATVDIDLLIPPEALPAVKEAVATLSYEMETDLTELAGGTVTITRMTKFFSDSEDFVSVDLLHGAGALKSAFQQRQKVQSEFGVLWVLPANALIEMKQLRGSKQDIADIENLKDLTNES
jgi:hypothetical protein